MHRSAEEFEPHRPLLLGLAYRLLGSMWDAEDVVQDAYLRWLRTDRSAVREPRAYLITLTARLALDQLKSARVVREAYPGPWLPEPVDDSTLGPLETAELRDTVSLATLHMMERLTPPQRAVYVLREAFGLPYEEVADVIGTSAATCRQHHRRARDRIAGGGRPLQPSAEEHRRLLAVFLEAARTGDLSALAEVLADDITVWNDGGGRIRAARNPIVGRSAALAFLTGLHRRYALATAEVVETNGQPALWLQMGGQDQVVAFDIRDGRIHQVFAVLNPEKLTSLHRRPAGGDPPVPA